jgi:hypothetical protein
MAVTGPNPLLIPDTLSHIFYFLSNHDLDIVSEVSRLWYTIADEARESRKREIVHLVLVLGDWVAGPTTASSLSTSTLNAVSANAGGHAVNNGTLGNGNGNVDSVVGGGHLIGGPVGLAHLLPFGEADDIPPAAEAAQFLTGETTSRSQRKPKTLGVPEEVIREALKVGLVAAEVDPGSLAAREAVERGLVRVIKMLIILYQ